MIRTNQNNAHSTPLDLSKLRHQRLKEAVRRDIIFILFVIVSYIVVAFVEKHASNPDIRSLYSISIAKKDDDDTLMCLSIKNNDGRCSNNATYDVPNNSSTKILDAGFIITTPLHTYLSNNRYVNDILAGLNSVLILLPLGYVAYVTIWRGDFRLSFRIVATSLFRTLCGWLT